MRIGVASDTVNSVVEDVREVIRLLESAGATVDVEKRLGEHVGREGISLAKMRPEILVVVGSDKTLLNTLIRIGSREVPVLPVASGEQPSFLFDVCVRNFELVVSDLINHQWTVEHHARLSVEIARKSTPPLLNEVAIFPRRSATIMHYSLYLDDEEFWRDSSDGLIVSTPTGSTAYSMSVGGPIVLGPAPVLTVIPVNSTNPARRSLVLPHDMRIEIRELSSSVGIEAILDGQKRISVNGGPVTVTRSQADAVFVKLTEERVAALRGKLLKKVEVFSKVAQALPPSAKLVLKVLEYHDHMTQKEIVEETKLPPRTARHALSILLSEGLVTKHLSLRDSRQSLFSLARGDSGKGSGVGEK